MEDLSTLRCELGEGARNVDGALHFVDLLAGTVFRLNHSGFQSVIQSTQPVGAVAPVAGRPELLLLAEGLGVRVVDLSCPAERLPFGADFADQDCQPSTHRVNDAVCDSFGSLWVGTMPYGRGRPGRLFRVFGDGRVVTVIDEVACPNGPAFSCGVGGDFGVVYVADTMNRTVLRAKLNSGGWPGEFNAFVEIADGLPDGMTVDDEGCLWVAIWGAGEVRRYAPGGDMLERRRVPAQQPTSVCLMPIDGAPALVVTSARVGLTRPGRGDGAVWVDPCTATAAPTLPFTLPVFDA